MNYLENCTHKETWSRRGEAFCIEVVRWESKGFDDKTEYIWNIYCYIYEGHDLFFELTDEFLFGGGRLNFHHGCTYGRWFRDAENIVRTKQYGCDYNHIWDVDIKDIKDPKEAYEVFNDAEDLFEQLNS